MVGEGLDLVGFGVMPPPHSNFILHIKVASTCWRSILCDATRAYTSHPHRQEGYHLKLQIAKLISGDGPHDKAGSI